MASRYMNDTVKALSATTATAIDAAASLRQLANRVRAWFERIRREQAQAGCQLERKRRMQAELRRQARGQVLLEERIRGRL